MTIRVGINGFGRIGRAFVRAYYALPYFQRKDVSITAINTRNGNADDIAHLLKYDSVHGVWEYDVRSNGEDRIVVCRDGLSNRMNALDDEAVQDSDYEEIAILNYDHPKNIAWQDFSVDVVLECSGKFNNVNEASGHFEGKVSYVIVSAPCKGCEKNIILGVNDSDLEAIISNIRTSVKAVGVGAGAGVGASMGAGASAGACIGDVISIGSCTTNALAPVLLPIHKALGVESGFMTTIHSYTSDQRLIDASHKDRRRARAACMSIIPTSSGATKMIGQIIPELAGRIDGAAIRVPTPNVSLVDFSFWTRKRTSVLEIEKIVREAAGRHQNVIYLNTKELVSVDFNKTKYSAIFDATQTSVVNGVGANGSFCRIAIWYDNEFGFVNRMLDVVLTVL